jgi:hypothetical protein
LWWRLNDRDTAASLDSVRRVAVPFLYVATERSVAHPEAAVTEFGRDPNPVDALAVGIVCHVHLPPGIFR